MEKFINSKFALTIICTFIFWILIFPHIYQYSMMFNIYLLFLTILIVFFKFKYQKINKLIIIFLLVVGLVLIFDQFRSLRGVEVGSALLSILGLLKILEMKNKRDIYPYVIMMQISQVANLINSEDSWLIIHSVISVPLLFLLIFFIKEDKLILNANKIKSFLKIILLSIPLTIAFFILFPRINFLGFIGAKEELVQTGFTEKLILGEYYRIINNDKVIFRAKFLKGTTDISKLYWRGAALDRTDGFNWYKGKIKNFDRYSITDNQIYRYVIEFDESEQTNLFLLKNTNKFNNRAYRASGKLIKQSADTYRFIPYGKQKIRFDLSVFDVKKYFLTNKQKIRYLQLPENISKEVKSFARDFIKDGESKRELIIRFLTRFSKNNYSYSLEPNSQNNTLNKFFFKSKTGFCEHYASATAIFFRLFNIPTRVVVGFHGGEYNQLGDYYLISNEDAHTWVETWLDKEGWVSWDPIYYISPDRINLGMKNLLLKRGSKKIRYRFYFLDKVFLFIDNISFQLNQFIMGYDYEFQRNIFKNLGKKYRSILFIILCIITFIFIFALYFLLTKSSSKTSLVDKWYVILCKKLNKFKARKHYMGPMQYLNYVCPLVSDDKRQIVIDAFSLYIKLKYSESNFAKKEQIKKFCKLVKMV